MNKPFQRIQISWHKTCYNKKIVEPSVKVSPSIVPSSELEKHLLNMPYKVFISTILVHLV